MNFPAPDHFDSLTWRLRAGQQLRMISGEEESVVYNDCSGETHLLSAIAVELLQQLEKEAADFSAISAGLAQAWEFESDDAFRDTVRGLLAELHSSWLIEACRT